MHKELGLGFLESIYHRALEIEFSEAHIDFESEKETPVYYHKKITGTHRLDFLIEGEITLELKTVEEIHKKYYAQVRSYLKATNKEIGLLVNFADFNRSFPPQRNFICNQLKWLGFFASILYSIILCKN